MYISTTGYEYYRETIAELLVMFRFMNGRLSMSPPVSVRIHFFYEVAGVW